MPRARSNSRDSELRIPRAGIRNRDPRAFMNDLPEALTGLHDATLVSVEFDWRERRCTFFFQGGPGDGLQDDFSIVFNDVTKLTIPSERPWGTSLSLLEVD